MFFELIGTLLAGVAAALLVWALSRLLKGRLPSWLIPASAGAAMLVATISSEYGWYARTAATLPERMIIAQTVEESVFYRPWSYLKPYVSRFVAADPLAARVHPDQPDRRIVDLLFFGRWSRTAQIPMLFDCAENMRADVTEAITFGEGGAVEGVRWRSVPADDPVQAAACTEL
jgi:hypothetical protein